MSNIWASFTEYIINNYKDSTKIVEVGIGKVTEPNNILKDKLPNTQVIGVDIYPCNDNIIQDDITSPRDEIYEDADLIYSIRPPEELQRSIVRLALKYDCDCIIKPLSTEEIVVELQSRLRLVNYKRSVFYVLK